MQTRAKKFLIVLCSLVIVLGYFFIGGYPLAMQVILEPVWVRSLESSPEAGKLQNPFIFRLDNMAGYFDANGQVSIPSPGMQNEGAHISISTFGYALYSGLSDGFVVRDPRGKEISRSRANGYPLLLRNHVLAIGNNQSSLSLLDSSGQVIWSYHFGSIITTSSASNDLLVFGLLNGTIIGMNLEGKKVIDFSPKGSRINAVYGVSVSSDSSMVAAITGLDKQRLVILKKLSKEYRVIYHKYLSSNFRHPVRIAFTDNLDKLVYETNSGVGIYNIKNRRESLYPDLSTGKLGLSLEFKKNQDWYLVFLTGKKEKMLSIIDNADRQLVNLALSGEFIEARANSVFIGMDKRILRLDLGVR